MISGVYNLLDRFPDLDFDPANVAAYNAELVEEIEHIRDFIVLHYCTTQRNDTPFWDHCRTMALPDTLVAKLELWTGKGRVFREQGELFTPDSWIAVLLGQRVAPQSFDPLAAALPAGETARFLAHVREMIDKTAAAMPTHEQFIAQHCAAPRRHVA